MKMELVAGTTVACEIILDEEVFPVVLDTWNEGFVSMTPEDFAKVNGKKRWQGIHYEGISADGKGYRHQGRC